MFNILRNKKILQDGIIALDATSKSLTIPRHNIPHLSLAILALILIGILAQFSAGASAFAISHIIKWSIALTATVILSQMNFQTILKSSLFLYIILLLLLIYVEMTGWISKGAQRWIDFGIIKVEPSEFFKIILPLLITNIIAHKKWSLIVIIECLLYIIPVVVLIMKQPDLGTALMVLMLCIITMIAGNISWVWIISPFFLALSIFPYLWGMLHTYQKNRILNLFNPQNDPLGSGYHIMQSIIAVGSGGIFGKGALNNTQSQLEYLPEHATDFVFALFAEEYGFLGSCILISIFLYVSLLLLRYASQSKNRATSIILQVIASQIALSSFINIAMVVGLVPVVGVPLPIISLGGSNALMNGISLGVAACCIKRIHIERSFS